MGQGGNILNSAYIFLHLTIMNSCTLFVLYWFESLLGSFLDCEHLHVCTLCIWCCEHTKFCVEVFMHHILIFIHSLMDSKILNYLTNMEISSFLGGVLGPKSGMDIYRVQSKITRHFIMLLSVSVYDINLLVSKQPTTPEHVPTQSYNLTLNRLAQR